MRNKTSSDSQLMAKHYVIAAIWADAPEGTNPRATNEMHKDAERICCGFLDSIGDVVRVCEQAYHANGYGAHPGYGNDRSWLAAMGHDLWLTHRGHGTGFWDRETLPESTRDYLASKSEMFSDIELVCYRGWAYLG